MKFTEIIEDSIKFLIPHYIEAAIKGEDTTSVLDRETLAEYLGACKALTAETISDLTSIIQLEDKLFPHLAYHKHRAEILEELQKLFDAGLTVDSEYLDSENILDCRDYYERKVRYEVAIYKVVGKELQDKLADLEEEFDATPIEVESYKERFSTDVELYVKLKKVIKHVRKAGNSDVDSYQEDEDRYEEISENLTEGLLTKKAYLFLKEDITNVIATAWTFIKNFNDKLEDKQTQEAHTKLLKATLTHIALVVKEIEEASKLDAKDVLSSLKALMSLTSLLTAFDNLDLKAEDVEDSEVAPRFKRVTDRLKEVEGLDEVKDQVQGMIQAITTNITKYRTTQGFIK